MKEVQAYKCEYCLKLYQRQAFCLSHETFCRKNPANVHVCTSCNYLEITQRVFINHILKFDEVSEVSGETKRFHCSKLNIDLHSRAITKSLAFKYDEYFMDTVLMPNACDEWQERDYLKDVQIKGIAEFDADIRQTYPNIDF